jgi:hypothetical protein
MEPRPTSDRVITVYTFGDSILDCGHYNAHGVTPGALLVRNDDALFPEFRGRDLSARGQARLVHRARDGATVDGLAGSALLPRADRARAAPGLARCRADLGRLAGEGVAAVGAAADAQHPRAVALRATTQLGRPNPVTEHPAERASAEAAQYFHTDTIAAGTFARRVIDLVGESVAARLE